jgi:hypothetical protein
MVRWVFKTPRTFTRRSCLSLAVTVLYQVVEASDGVDALAKSTVQKVDLFITDLTCRTWMEFSSYVSCAP